MASRGRDYVAIAVHYAEDLVSGKQVGGQWAVLAARRFLKDLNRKTSGRWFPYRFDAWHACDACDFVEKMPHVEGEWDHATLILEPWQIFILVNVFGFRQAYGKCKGKRRFNTAYIELGRKNGKSAFTSAVSLYCLTCEQEPGPQVKTAATTGDQARIVFSVAKKMADKTHDFREAFGVTTYANAIVCNDNAGSIQPINAKASTQDGLNPHLTVIDELHAHKDRSLFDVLRSARGARKNPLSWYITTAGYNLAGVCYEQHSFVKKILEKVILADHYFGIIYSLDITDKDETSDDPFDESVWVKANPNLGISITLQEMRQYAKEASENPGQEGEYKTKRCNLWLNAAQSWLSMDDWDRCREPGLALDQFEGADCWLGGDLADRNDVTSLALVFKRDEDLVTFAWHFLPRDLVQAAAERTTTHYLVWEKAGRFILTDGNITDYGAIEDFVRELADRFVINRMTFDQYGSAQMTSNLAGDGLPAQVMHKNAKNYTDPSKDLEARVQVKRFKHDGDPVLKWMASNCVVTRGVDGSMIPKKENKDSPNKIDGIDAILMGFAGYLQDHENEQTESIYSEGAIY